MTQRSFPRHLFGLAAIGALLLGGCDVLDDPVIPLTINYRGDAAPPSFDAMSTGPQHVLLEDFTAHQCGNCPPAGVLAEQLAEEHEGLVHVLAVHVGVRHETALVRAGVERADALRLERGEIRCK